MRVLRELELHFNMVHSQLLAPRSGGRPSLGVDIKLDGVISQYYNDDSVEVKLTEW